MKTKTQKIIISAMFAALTCVATMIIKIPYGNGYLNAGDCIVLVAAWTLSPLYGFLAAGIGSALADIFSGYIAYAPATFIIKGVMALIAHSLLTIPHKKAANLPAIIISGLSAELTMVFGYYLYETLLYGFIPAASNIPGNCAQGVLGLILATIIIKGFEKGKYLHKQK